MKKYIKFKSTNYMSLEDPGYFVGEILTGSHWIDEKPIYRRGIRKFPIYVPMVNSYKYNVDSVIIKDDDTVRNSKNIIGNVAAALHHEGFSLKLTFNQSDVGKKFTAQLKYELDYKPTSYNNGFLIRDYDVPHSSTGYDIAPQVSITNTTSGSCSINFTVSNVEMYFIVPLGGWDGSSQIRINNLVINEAIDDPASLPYIDSLLDSFKLSDKVSECMVIEYTKTSI